MILLLSFQSKTLYVKLIRSRVAGDGEQVRGMAAATLKSITRWMEGQLDGAGPCQALVQQVLTQLVQEANPGGARYSGAQGPTIHEHAAWDALMPTQQSFGATETAGQL